MARAVKQRVSRAVKQKAKKAVSKVEKVALKAAPTPAKKITKVTKSKTVAKAREVNPVAHVSSDEPKKKVSQAFLEAIQKRRQAREDGPVQKVPGRRGRRPKNVEYTPNNNEEESYSVESEYERLEYDTGIRLKETSDDKGYNLDRFEDFDEELNFDW